MSRECARIRDRVTIRVRVSYRVRVSIKVSLLALYFIHLYLVIGARRSSIYT